MNLTKSEYLLFLKHRAWLWLKKHDKAKLPPIEANTQAKFDAGNRLEVYAEQLFPSGQLLTGTTMTDKALDLACSYLSRTYSQRVSALLKQRKQADAELRKLYETRQALIEKNLAGIYSDEMFQEQIGLLEERIATVQITKSDALIARYNVEDLTRFIRVKFRDLAKTYAQPSLEQKRMPLCSIFPSGLVWGYPGYLDTPFSPCYHGYDGCKRSTNHAWSP